MKTIDFFVHPDILHEQSNGAYHSESYQRYLDQLVERWESSDCPVLLKGIEGHERFLKKVSKKGERFQSCSFALYDMPPFEYGEVHPKDWEKFTALIDKTPAEEIRVHGSFYGQCTEGFAVQLLAYRHLGEHWHNWLDLSDDIGNGRIKKKIKEQKTKRKELEKQGIYVKSNVRFGIMYMPPADKIKVVPPTGFLKFWVNLPYGNITYQLTDEKTKVTEYQKK